MNVLVHLCRVDIQLDDLRLAGKFCRIADDTVAEPGTEHHQQVSDMSEHRMALGFATDHFALMPTLADIAGPALFTKLFNAFKAGAKHESD